MKEACTGPSHAHCPEGLNTTLLVPGRDLEKSCKGGIPQARAPRTGRGQEPPMRGAGGRRRSRRVHDLPGRSRRSSPTSEQVWEGLRTPALGLVRRLGCCRRLELNLEDPVLRLEGASPVPGEHLRVTGSAGLGQPVSRLPVPWLKATRCAPAFSLWNMARPGSSTDTSRCSTSRCWRGGGHGVLRANCCSRKQGSRRSQGLQLPDIKDSCLEL